MVNYGKEWQGINFADAQDPYYNAEKAKAKFAEAKKELEAQGVTFPIHLDLPVDQVNKTLLPKIHSLNNRSNQLLGQKM